MIEDNLKPVDNSSLVDKVEANLIELLKQQKLKLGDAIPKEIDLAKTLGVSRTVVREALLRLRMMGLLESKKKKGAVITSPDIFGIMSKSMYPDILGYDTLKDIFEIRLVLEVGMADFIMEYVTTEDIEELREIVNTEVAGSRDHTFQIEHEIKFHSKLYEITGNETLKKFQKMLLPIFDYVEKSGMLDTDIQAKKYVSHKGIVDIIEHGSAETLRNGIRNHLEYHFARTFLKKTTN